MMRMRGFTSHFLLPAATALVYFPLPVPAAHEYDGMTREEKREAKKQAREEKRNANKKVDWEFNFKREFAALEEAATLLESITDEKSASQVANKLSRTFTLLPIPTKGTDTQLEEWARLQNKVNAKMEELQKLDYFESSGLQKAWTLITDPNSRRTNRIKA